MIQILHQNAVDVRHFRFRSRRNEDICKLFQGYNIGYIRMGFNIFKLHATKHCSHTSSVFGQSLCVHIQND